MKELKELEEYINCNGYFKNGRYWVEIEGKEYDVEKVAKVLDIMNLMGAI